MKGAQLTTHLYFKSHKEAIERFNSRMKRDHVVHSVSKMLKRTGSSLTDSEVKNVIDVYMLVIFSELRHTGIVKMGQWLKLKVKRMPGRAARLGGVIPGSNPLNGNRVVLPPCPAYNTVHATAMKRFLEMIN